MLGGEVGCFRCSSLQRRNADSNLPPLGRHCSPALLGLLDIQFWLSISPSTSLFFDMAGHVKSGLSISVQKRAWPGRARPVTRRKDRYQPRAASASQPKTLKTYACARDCTPRHRAMRPPRCCCFRKPNLLLRGERRVGLRANSGLRWCERRLDQLRVETLAKVGVRRLP